MKRFVASELWEKPWYRKLPPHLKSFWMYLIHRCDHAGVWEADFEAASFHIGHEVTESDMTVFGDRVVKLPSGKWWLTTFMEFQYGSLSDASPAHKPVFISIEKNRLWDRLSCTLYHRGQDKDKDKDKDKKGDARGGEPACFCSLDHIREVGTTLGLTKQHLDYFIEHQSNVSLWSFHPAPTDPNRVQIKDEASLRQGLTRWIEVMEKFEKIGRETA